jgi:Ca-activated chloride channel homolog
MMQNLISIFCLLSFPVLLLAQSAGVELKLELDRAQYLSQSEKTAYLKASDISSDVDLGESPSPLNIALVVDRSGSMAGDRIEHLRKALIEFMARLSANDWVSLTVYGSTARTIIEVQQVSSLTNPGLLIQQIEAEGGAAPYEAITLAASQLRKNFQEGAVNRLIFLTDGRATSGPRESEDFLRLTDSLVREGISISTIGLGEEFDEDLLKQMAESSRGEFYFAQTEAEIASVFSDEILRLSDVVAEGVQIEIRFRNSVRPEEIMGRTGEISGRVVRVDLGQLLLSENKYVLISTRMPGRLSYMDRALVAEATLTYTPVGEVPLEPVEVKKSVRADFLNHVPSIIKSINHEVIYSVLSHDIAESLAKAIGFADEGRLERGIRELEGTYKDLSSLNYDLEDPVIESLMGELEQQIESLKSRGLDRSIGSVILS